MNFHSKNFALFSAVMLDEVHVTKTSDVEEKFDGAFNMFCASHAVTSKLENEVPKPKLSTIQEHFRKMVRSRRTENRINIVPSGIAKNYGELEQLLDTVINEMDWKKKLDDTRKEKDKKKEEALKKVGRQSAAWKLSVNLILMAMTSK